MAEYKRKYNDEFSLKTAQKILSIFYLSSKKVKDYKFDGDDPEKLMFKFYVPIIVQDGRSRQSSESF